MLHANQAVGFQQFGIGAIDYNGLQVLKQRFNMLLDGNRCRNQVLECNPHRRLTVQANQERLQEDKVAKEGILNKNF